MKKCKKALTLFLAIVLMLQTIFFIPTEYKADMLETQLTYLETSGPLQVIFYYEVEKPELVFVSPSGNSYSEGKSSELKVWHGTGWSAYQIDNAEAGQWMLQYDKKGNETISFNIHETIEGVAIQYFKVDKIDGDTATVSFSVDKGDETVWYDYTIFAITEYGTTELVSGSASTGSDQTINVKLNISSSNNCVLKLNVLHRGDIETSDSVSSDPFSYQNPNVPAAMENFWAYVDVTNLFCELDWYEYRNGDLYQVEVIADGKVEKPVLKENIENETSTYFYYPAGTKSLEIKLYYFSEDIISTPVIKTIDFENGEYLKITDDDITGLSVLPLKYSTVEKSELSLVLNGVNSKHSIEGVGELSLSLLTGANTIEATFAGGNNIIYKVSKEIYHTWLTPTIELFEDLNGKTFYTDKMLISGKVENATKFLINNVEVVANADGTFNHEVQLIDGSNVIIIEAYSEGGLSSQYSLNVMKISSQTAVENVMDWLSIVVVVVIVIIFLLGFFLVLRDKKEKKEISKVQKQNSVLLIGGVIAGVLALLEGFVVFAYIKICQYTNSLEFVELAKNSIDDAAKYLEYESLIQTALFVILAVIIVLVLLIVGFILARRKYQQMNK